MNDLPGKDIYRFNTKSQGKDMSGKEALLVWSNQGEKYAVPWLYCIKKSIYDSNEIKFPVGRVHEDFAIIPILILNAKTVRIIDFIGYQYIQYENSLMHVNINSYEKSVKKLEDFLYAYDYVRNYIENFFEEDEIDKYYKNKILSDLEYRLKDMINKLDSKVKEFLLKSVMSKYAKDSKDGCVKDIKKGSSEPRCIGLTMGKNLKDSCEAIYNELIKSKGVNYDLRDYI